MKRRSLAESLSLFCFFVAPSFLAGQLSYRRGGRGRSTVLAIVSVRLQKLKGIVLKSLGCLLRGHLARHHCRGHLAHLHINRVGLWYVSDEVRVRLGKHLDHQVHRGRSPLLGELRAV